MNNDNVTPQEMDNVLKVIEKILEAHAGKIFTELNLELLKIFKDNVPVKLLGYAYWKLLAALSDGAINFFSSQTGVEQKNIIEAFNQWAAITQKMQSGHQTLQ